MTQSKGRLFIYGINETVSNSELESKFGEYGPVTDSYNTGKGYAFVTFADPNDGDLAMQMFHGEVIFGQRVKVDWANPRGGGEGKNDEDYDDGENYEEDDEGVRQALDLHLLSDSEDEKGYGSGDDSGDGGSDDEDHDKIFEMMVDIKDRMERIGISEVSWNRFLVRNDCSCSECSCS